MASKDRDVIYVANTTGFAVLPDGTEFFFREAVTKVRVDHPVMKACPRNFEPLDPTVGVVDYVKP
jgi:hypothetical protein